MPPELALFLLILLSLHVIVAVFANRRGHNAATYFLLSLFLSPLIALVILAISERSRKVAVEPPATGMLFAESGAAVTSQWGTPTRSQGRPLAVLAALAVVMVVAALIVVAWKEFQGNPGVAASTPSAAALADGLPPPGQIWFGRSYDAETFEIEGRLATGKIRQHFMVVGQLGMSAARRKGCSQVTMYCLLAFAGALGSGCRGPSPTGSQHDR